MAKRIEIYRQSINVGGKEYTAVAWYEKTRYGFHHIAEIWEDYRTIAEGEAVYHNRTWEQFNGETAIADAISKLNRAEEKPLRDALHEVFITQYISKENERYDAWFKAFKSSYDSLSEKTKQRIANANVCVTSTEQAESIVRMGHMIDVMEQMSNS